MPTTTRPGRRRAAGPRSAHAGPTPRPLARRRCCRRRSGVRRRLVARAASGSRPDAADRRCRDPPDDVVADFEEYTWLYREAWTPEIERWLFSVVPTAMMFDDHDMIDDWNISAIWVEEIRSQPWWQEHIIGGLVSYWVYQHLGNLSPDEIEQEGMLADSWRSTMPPRCCVSGRSNRRSSPRCPAGTGSVTPARSVGSASS